MIIFLVHRDPSWRAAAAGVLQGAGHAVQAFASPLAFLEATRAAGAGCVVIDVHLPDPNGLEVKALLREHGCALPVVFTSDDGDVRVAVEAMKAGAVDFLAGPLDEEALLASVARALARASEASAAQAVQAQEEASAARLAALSTRQREGVRAGDAGDAEQADRGGARDLDVDRAALPGGGNEEARGGVGFRDGEPVREARAGHRGRRGVGEPPSRAGRCGRGSRSGSAPPPQRSTSTGDDAGDGEISPPITRASPPEARSRSRSRPGASRSRVPLTAGDPRTRDEPSSNFVPEQGETLWMRHSFQNQSHPPPVCGQDRSCQVSVPQVGGRDHLDLGHGSAEPRWPGSPGATTAVGGRRRPTAFPSLS